MNGQKITRPYYSSWFEAPGTPKTLICEAHRFHGAQTNVSTLTIEEKEVDEVVLGLELVAVMMTL